MRRQMAARTREMNFGGCNAGRAGPAGTGRVGQRRMHLWDLLAAPGPSIDQLNLLPSRASMAHRCAFAPTAAPLPPLPRAHLPPHARRRPAAAMHKVGVHRLYKLQHGVILGEI